MEVRLRSQVSRTKAGYSIESTLEVTSPIQDMGGEADMGEEVNVLSAFQVEKLQEHMAALGAAFPTEAA